MGTIVKRPRKGRGVAYLAQISIMQDHKIVFRQAKTFDGEKGAAAWIAKRKAELAKTGALSEAAIASGARGSTLGDAIDRYSADTLRAPGRTKTQTLRAIRAHDLGSMRCSAIGSRDIVAFAQALRAKVQLRTVGNYLSHLASVFAIARPAWGYDLDHKPSQIKVAKRLGLTSKSRERSRRPTIDELDLLMGHFATVRTCRPGSNPMGATI
jgi:hypothetical protein